MTRNHPNRGRRNKQHSADMTPTPDLVRRVRELAGLDQSAAGAVIRSSGRAWYAYEDAGDSGRRMHPGLLELFCLKRGLANAFTAGIPAEDLERALLSLTRSRLAQLQGSGELEATSLYARLEALEDELVRRLAQQLAK